MEKMNVVRKSLIKDIRGSQFAEYVTLTGVVALATLAAFTNLGKAASQKIHRQASTVQSIGVNR